MGLGFGDSRAAEPRACQEPAAIATPGIKNVPAAPAAPPQLVSMPVSQLSPATWSSQKRVKVFRLNNGGGWDDTGTGHVTIDDLTIDDLTIDDLQGGLTLRREAVLAVIDEEDNEPMLLHLITPDDIYRKQKESFITWCDPEACMTLSLSFQDAADCSNIWDTICQVQRKQRPGLRNASDTNAPQG